MSRSKIIVEDVKVSGFPVKGSCPWEFTGPASLEFYVHRVLKSGEEIRAVLAIAIEPGYFTDGASTFWPISKLVPQWRDGDDEYNAAPVAHDVLYMLGGVIAGEFEAVHLSREEVDDILRGIWRCWGMGRLLAGFADKGVEIFAGGKRHWGSDAYGVRQFARAKWTVME